MRKFMFRRYFWLVRNTYRYDGFVFLPWKLAVEALAPLGSLRLTSFYQKDLTRPLKKPSTKPGLTVCRAAMSDIDNLTTLAYERSDGEEGLKDFMHWRIQTKIVDLLRRGHLCFLGKVGEKVVHYNWIFFHWYDSILGRYVHLMEDEAFLNDAYTAEPWRGKAIHTLVQYHMLLYLQKAGYRRAYTLAFTDNRSSLQTHDRLGWERTGLMLYFGTHKGNWLRFWRIRGTLDPFMERQIPSRRTYKGV